MVELDEKQHICAEDRFRKQESCKGDSGGPLVQRAGQEPMRFYIVGIVSSGVRCGTANLPGLYTRVTNHLEWINKHV